MARRVGCRVPPIYHIRELVHDWLFAYTVFEALRFPPTAIRRLINGLRDWTLLIQLFDGD